MENGFVEFAVSETHIAIEVKNTRQVYVTGKVGLLAKQKHQDVAKAAFKLVDDEMWFWLKRNCRLQKGDEVFVSENLKDYGELQIEVLLPWFHHCFRGDGEEQERGRRVRSEKQRVLLQRKNRYLHSRYPHLRVFHKPHHPQGRKSKMGSATPSRCFTLAKERVNFQARRTKMVAGGVNAAT
jgi:hypothetical protein